MAVVTGTLLDFGELLMGAYQPEIAFRPSSAATSVGTGYVFASRPITVVPAADGSFSVTLEPNISTTPQTWYTVEIRWLDAAGNYVSSDWLQGRLVVPIAGGPIGSGMIRASSAPLRTWLVTENVVPDEAFPGDYMFNTITNDLSLVS